jgi:putative transposase
VELDEVATAAALAAEVRALRARLRVVEAALGAPAPLGHRAPPSLPELARRLAALERRAGVVPGLAPLPGLGAASAPGAAEPTTAPQARQRLWRECGQAALAAILLFALVAWLLRPVGVGDRAVGHPTGGPTVTVAQATIAPRAVPAAPGARPGESRCVRKRCPSPIRAAIGLENRVVIAPLGGALLPGGRCYDCGRIRRPLGSSPSVKLVWEAMIWWLLVHLLSFLVDLLTTSRRADRDKALEILLLQHQVRLLQRHRGQPVRLARWEKLTLAVLAAKLARRTRGGRARLSEALLIIKPDTVLRWHRDLVRRKWTRTRRRPAGRPPLAAEVEVLSLRLAQENPRWGYGRIHGEWAKLGHSAGRSTVRDVLKRHRVPPAPQRRAGSSTWRDFLRRHQGHLLACDLFTVDTLFLKAVHVLFFIELGTRRVHLAGCTTKPTAAWVTQQARQFSWTIQAGALPVRFLIRDRDGKFPPAFDAVFRSEGVRVMRTPYRAPNANAYAERWIRSARTECLDHLLILNEAHLWRVLSTYVAHYNQAGPHQGLDQRTPVGPARRPQHGPVRRRAVLGGLLHDYYREAA